MDARNIFRPNIRRARKMSLNVTRKASFWKYFKRLITDSGNARRSWFFISKIWHFDVRRISGMAYLEVPFLDDLITNNYISWIVIEGGMIGRQSTKPSATDTPGERVTAPPKNGPPPGRIYFLAFFTVFFLFLPFFENRRIRLWIKWASKQTVRVINNKTQWWNWGDQKVGSAVGERPSQLLGTRPYYDSDDYRICSRPSNWKNWKTIRHDLFWRASPLVD